MALEYTIVTVGGGEAIFSVFNGIAALLSLDNQKSFGATMMQLIGIIGVLWTSVLMYTRGSINSGASWFGWFILCTTMLLVPKATIYIKDPLFFNNTPKKVDNVPWALAALAGSINQLFYEITKKAEAVFSVPDDLSYHASGSIFASRLIAKSKEFKVVDPVFKANLERFVQQCVIYDAMIGHHYSMQQLKASDDIWKLVSTNPSKVLGFLYKDDNTNEIVTCKAGVDKLKNGWDDQVAKAAIYYGKYFFPGADNRTAKAEFLSKLPLSYNTLAAISQNATNLLQQEFMANAIRDGSVNKASELGNSYILAKASLQQKSFFDTTGQVVGETLPLLKTVFECIAYAAFIFIFVLAPLPGGHKIIATYFRELLWIQSWPLLYAVLNFLFTIWAQKSSTAALGGYDSVTLFNSVALADANEGMKGMAGWLSLSVPALSRGLIIGSFNGFSHLADYVGNSIQSATTGASQEVVSGNLSLGNVNYANTSMQNLSGFQLHRSASHTSGQFSRNLSGGGMETVNQDNVIYNMGEGQDVSKFGTTVSFNRNISEQLSQSASTEKSLSQQMGTQASQSLSLAQSSAADLIKRMSNSLSSSDTFSLENASSENKTINQTIDFAKQLKKEFGLSDSSALQVAVGVSGAAQSPTWLKWGFGLSAKGEISANATYAHGNNTTQADIMDFAKRQGYNQTFDEIVRGVNSQTNASHNNEEKQLAHNLGVNYREAKDFSESHTIHLQAAERLSRAASHMHSSSFNVNEAINQRLLEYIAVQPAGINGGAVGHNAAAKIMSASSGPLVEKRNEYLQDFQKNYVNNAVEFFKTHDVHTEQDLQKAYASLNHNLQMVKPRDESVQQFQDQHINSMQRVDNQIQEKYKEHELSIDRAIQRQARQIYDKGEALTNEVNFDKDANVNNLATQPQSALQDYVAPNANNMHTFKAMPQYLSNTKQIFADDPVDSKKQRKFKEKHVSNDDVLKQRE